ncbi:MAG: hypothetical protein OEM29_03165 [Thermoplasmata archaeon]|nr:hypothetical protein [Thermoplasmata archaeon]
MFVLQIAKHSAESCPMYEHKYKSMAVKWYEKVEEQAAKHKVKVLGIWNDHSGHAVYAIYEAPDMDAYMHFQMEPECMAPLAFNKCVHIPVFSAAETLAMLKR